MLRGYLKPTVVLQYMLESLLYFSDKKISKNSHILQIGMILMILGKTQPKHKEKRSYSEYA